MDSHNEDYKDTKKNADTIFFAKKNKIDNIYKKSCIFANS